eukprot:gb/GECG01005472.1/.p1 GENE.gb/GECG01005472.1/~~gb/GECG01005472.1/.p1  ORF type:complete len:251 (+),score=20.69 gb/GECG01005472.1/:1-753(+)
MASLTRYYMRKALRKTQSIWQEYILGAKSSFMFGMSPDEKAPLFEFKRYEDIDRFHVHSDRVMGGSSVCSFSIKQYENFSTGCFQGILRGNKSFGSSNSFCSFRTKPSEKLKNFHVYSALEMRLRSDGRRYQVYLSDLPNEEATPDIFRAEFQVLPYEWATIACPFDEFMTIRKGIITPYQRPLDRECLHGFGISVADGQDGPFYLELQYVNVLRTYDPSLYKRLDCVNQLDGYSRQREAIPSPSKKPLA